MHELPVVLDIVKVVGAEAEKRSIKRITRINLVIGELSAIISESVQMYFEIVAEKTPCEGALLCFEHVPAMLRCEACGREFAHNKSFDCPDCGGGGILIKGTGREFYIKSIEGE